MTHPSRERNSIYINSEGPNKSTITKGLSWLIDLAKNEGKTSALIALPQPANLDGVVADVIGSKAVAALKRGEAVNLSNAVSLSLLTQRKDINVHDGPILAVYPNKSLLDKLDHIPGVTDILVIPWSLEETEFWRDAWQASEMGLVTASLSTKTFSDPVVEEALKSLTDNVNLSTGIAHPLDKAKTVDLFKSLKRAKIAYDPDEIRGWLVRHGWRTGSADDVADIAERISQGKPVQKFKGTGECWGSNIIEIWRERAKKSKD